MKDQCFDKGACVATGNHLWVSLMCTGGLEPDIFKRAVLQPMGPGGRDVSPSPLKDAHCDGAQPGIDLWDVPSDIGLGGSLGVKLPRMCVFALADLPYRGQSREDILVQGREDLCMRSCPFENDFVRRVPSTRAREARSWNLVHFLSFCRAVSRKRAVAGRRSSRRHVLRTYEERTVWMPAARSRNLHPDIPTYSVGTTTRTSK